MCHEPRDIINLITILRYGQYHHYLEKFTFKYNEIPFYIHQMTYISTSNNARPWQELGELENATKIY